MEKDKSWTVPPREEAQRAVRLKQINRQLFQRSDGLFQYNVQISTDARAKIIVGVTQAATDAAKLKPAVERIEANMGEKPKQAEFPNAWIKDKIGLRQFRLRGLVEATLEAVWACLIYNI